jgi:hypothetical protein
MRANRANAKRSTGPRTERGKAASRRNALKHGILSRSVDLPNESPRPDFCSVRLTGLPVSGVVGTDSALLEINRIWAKLARLVTFEKTCTRRSAGLEQNVRLIYRYERMLTRQLHARIREYTDLGEKNCQGGRYESERD